MVTSTREDPLAYSMGRRKRRSTQGGEAQKPETVAHPGKRRPGTKQFMLYMPPDLHTAVQLRKAVTGEDMGDIMLSILREGLAEELALVHRLRQ